MTQRFYLNTIYRERFHESIRRRLEKHLLSKNLIGGHSRLNSTDSITISTDGNFAQKSKFFFISWHGRD